MRFFPRIFNRCRPILSTGTAAGSYVALAALLLAPCPVQAQNLVTNPGFETGDFSGWSTTQTGPLFGVRNNLSHTGTYDAAFSAINGQDDFIAQNIATTAGTTYNFSFYLRNVNNNNDHFAAFFGNNKVFEVTDTVAPFDYTLFSYNLVASSANTRIAFAGNDRPGSFRLDDVNVSAVTPEAPPLVNLGAALLAPGMGGMVAFRRRKKAQNAA